MARTDEAEEKSFVKRLIWLAGIITSLGVIAGAVAFAGDTRWARIEDVKAWDTNIAAQVRYSSDKLRKQVLEDKIYEITTVPESKRTDTQRAVLDRSIRQMDEINQKWTGSTVHAPPPDDLRR